ncbi:RNA 2',3'-cyclic phosphodiesterase [Roseomonas sp. CECT 9278]|uniref:RNA 2',3'-cyclic phosphodiesterase n=1 Tax=Roseomonas sp. CECT 9278 TaxID=2845823 RepID=UPI001E292C29|nr:RNA 2',3'-cyclic phosphodiesterase [Roseomonas sp. CECT 9278]CAH0290393.1 RNA 2',3'-cyclic phosphodiesterase [Roseomonas sp. CECT 9278]
MLRLFVAFGLPPDIRSEVAGLAGGIPGARWVPPDNYHLTLRFIGEIENWRAQEVDDALAVIRGQAFDLALRGVGTFEKAGRIQSLWVGAERNDTLTHLQGKIETALQRIGLPPERKRFSPHVTLARVDRAPPDKVVAYVQAHNLFRAALVRVQHFTLFSSRLGKEASVYTPEVDYDLAARAAA